MKDLKKITIKKSKIRNLEKIFLILKNKEIEIKMIYYAQNHSANQKYVVFFEIYKEIKKTKNSSIYKKLKEMQKSSSFTMYVLCLLLFYSLNHLKLKNC